MSETGDHADPPSDTVRAFLAGDRPEDVAIYLADDHVDAPEKLHDFGEVVPGGILIVADGERGRSAFAAATGTDPMAFAKGAMDNDGTVARDLTGGDCPNDAETDHEVRYCFAFAEEQNEEVGGLYAEGAVMHAYVQCTCGTVYSEKWLAADPYAESTDDGSTAGDATDD